MSAFAYISILEVVLKLIIVYMLVIFSFDKLILYSFLILSIQILIRFCYSIYCNRHFEETKYKNVLDKTLFKEMTGFAGWSMFGNLAGVLFNQGLNMLLNVFLVQLLMLHVVLRFKYKMQYNNLLATFKWLSIRR